MDNLIQNFSLKSVSDFFKTKIAAFKSNRENLNYIIAENNYSNFSDLQKIGEVEFNNSDELIVFTCKFQGVLSERSSKKKQFEIAKKVLKEDFKDGAIFIFYDDNGCFRFSFIRKNYGNKDQKFSNWKRYTYFVEPSITNKTFKNRINGCNFSSLEDIQEAFSVEKLNKKFYEEIATAFYSLIGGKVSINKKEVSFNSCLQLPSTPTENRKVYQEFAVRLIGRTIFCWFLKNKKSDSGIPLIPEEWLSSNMVASVNNDQHNYYHSILEKLFFLVLNKKQEDRKPYVLPSNHEFVPFLNGGLFEAQDDDFFPKDSKGIHSQNFALNIPNQWFIDFFTVLEQYNFTIDENSINDFEVSIDPEMLGTIFENLLAEIDPDTEKSARKSTGSFYTPREIVDYMVEQSLLQYIKTKTNIEDEDQLEVLLKDDIENPFNEKQTTAILEALSEVKILDPACGSGAFPMGVLHKIIALLKKLDKNAVWWKAKQLEKIDNALVRKTMETKLDNANSDYIRKLGVIQHSIYGVDIQPIAAEISKLRSFLSLIIDENIDDKAENRGIEPLPNLEFKFVTANTLIGLEAEKQQTTFDFGETEELQNQLQKLRNNYLQATPADKQKLKTDFEKLQTQIYKNELKAGGQNKRAQQLASWKPFSNDSSTWFDPDWMFGVEKFDIVIGNPPYGAKFSDLEKKYLQLKYPQIKGQPESYEYFLFKSLDIFINDNGLTSYIIPTNFIESKRAENLRIKILNTGNINIISNFRFNVWNNNAAETLIFIHQKNRKGFTKVIHPHNLQEFLNNDKFEMLDQTKWLDSVGKRFIIRANNNIINKINQKSNQLGSIAEVSQGIIVYKTREEGAKNLYINSVHSKVGNWVKLLDSKSNLKPYKINWGGNYLNYGNWLWCSRDEKYFKSPKILFIRLRNKSLERKLIGAYDDKEFYNRDNFNNIILKDEKYDLKFILALFNSKLINYWYKSHFDNVNINPEQVKMIPIKEEYQHQQPFISIVNQILENKKQNLDTTDLEAKIDIMVYKLYELTYDEVLVVDPEFGLSEQEYNKYKY